MARRTLGNEALPMTPHELHLELALFAQRRLRPAFPGAPQHQADARLTAMEGAFLDEERAAVTAEAISAPADPEGFVAWFEKLKENGPGQGDPLFPWLADRASLAQMR